MIKMMALMMITMAVMRMIMSRDRQRHRNRTPLNDRHTNISAGNTTHPMPLMNRHSRKSKNFCETLEPRFPTPFSSSDQMSTERRPDLSDSDPQK
ncbi:hypothetical protein ElyMa_001595000 [Elysia marginata]|uniref:Secreted protein n=1 Tax=Elysia marginata TaxID=1093978 RepID=A0AAV4JF82_9GAST|nr:hypothetical protein ElyMa_001595000 [Elysia marginata]